MVRSTKEYVDPEILGHIDLELQSKGRISLVKAAKLFRIHHQTAHAQAKRGEIKTVRIGGRDWVLAQEVSRYLHQGKAKEEGDKPSSQS